MNLTLKHITPLVTDGVIDLAMNPTLTLPNDGRRRRIAVDNDGQGEHTDPRERMEVIL